MARPALQPEHTIVGSYLADAELLGIRTAQMHLALASSASDPAFTPEPFTPESRSALARFMSSQIMQTMEVARGRAKDHPELDELLSRESDLQESVLRVLRGNIGGQRIRIHGDYHLGQVLRTGDDFVIIDFEGEPMALFRTRRIKSSALWDVAAMLRSFHYAAYAILFGAAPDLSVREEDRAVVETGARFWHRWVSAAFLRAYLAESAKGTHLPHDLAEVTALLRAHLIEKAISEVLYELENRPDWVTIPVRGLLDLLE